jgi:hypothetical protein
LPTYELKIWVSYSVLDEDDLPLPNKFLFEPTLFHELLLALLTLLDDLRSLSIGPGPN